MSVSKSIEEAYDTKRKYHKYDLSWKNSFKGIPDTMNLCKESYHHHKQIRNVICRSLTPTLPEEDIW